MDWFFFGPGRKRPGGLAGPRRARWKWQDATVKSAREISPICTSQLKIALRRALLEDPELAELFAQGSTGSGGKAADAAILEWMQSKGSPKSQMDVAKKWLAQIDSDMAESIWGSIEAGILTDVATVVKDIKEEVCFYPFLLGAPIDIGVPYDASFSTTDQAILLRAQRIAKLPLPYVVSYRLFTSLVSSCYNHFALSCDMSASQVTSLKHAITAILVPKRSKWLCREALFSLVTPGHLLSPHLFLNYRHVIEYLLYIKHCDARRRTHLSRLWHDTLSLKWGPFFRLRSAAKHLGFYFEDPFVFVINDVAYSVDDDLSSIKHNVRDSYRQFYLAKASQRRQDCLGQTNLIDVANTRA